MEATLNIHTSTGDYPVFIGDDNFKNARDFVKGKCMIVTDSNVEPLYLEALKNDLKGIQVHSVTVPAGEKSKCKERLFEIIDELTRYGYCSWGRRCGRFDRTCRRTLYAGDTPYNDANNSPFHGGQQLRRKGCHQS